MKKYIIAFFLYLGLSNTGIAQNALDSISFTTLNNSQVNLRSYTGKKIAIVTIDASNPDTAKLRSYDSLYRHSNLVILGILVNDFGAAMDTEVLRSLFEDSIHIGFPVSIVSKGTRGIGQHPLLHWITTSSKKNHYDIDLNEAGESFLISSKGILYAVFRPGINLSSSFVQSALNSNPNK